MYIKLKEVVFRFEKIGENEADYFNTEDYSFYTEGQMREFVESGRYDEEKFLVVPVTDRDELALGYIKNINDKNLYRHFESIYGDNNFYGEFYRFVEGNRRLLDEWIEYEVDELINFAEKWCQQNGIRFTFKK